MLDVVAEHSVALLTVMRAVVGAEGTSPPDGPTHPNPSHPLRAAISTFRSSSKTRKSG